MSKSKWQTAVIGYGGTFNMAKVHAGQMKEAGFRFAAACDVDASRMKQAGEDFPDIRTFNQVEDLLAQPDIDLVTVITPHNTHSELAHRVLDSGKHCVLEKPMCIRADDAFALVSKAQERGLMLTVFHNRRWDSWYLTLKDLISRDLLGEIFHVEMFMGGYVHPGHWWRSDKTVSGGAFYDWGAHYLDWLLGVMPGKIKSVRGHIHDRVWNDVTNEDQVDSVIEFENGAVAQVQISSIARAGKAPVRILGTKGAVVVTDLWDGELRLHTDVSGVPVDTRVPMIKENPQAFYRNIYQYLSAGEELIVKPEQAARVIAVIETTERSAAEGRPLPVAFERWEEAE